MIRLENISVRFNKGLSAEVLALDNLHMELEQGSFNLIIGSNGSGKSTLLNLLAGNIFPDSGRILFQEKQIQKWPDFKRSGLISRVFQDPLYGTAPDLSMIENFRLASLRGATKKIHTGINKAFRQEISQLVEQLQMGLERRLDQPMRSFSGGQRQALSLIMATCRPSMLLLMDEPTAALDPKSAAIVFSLAQKIIREKGITGLMVTHEMKYCIQAGDRIIQFHEGKIIRDLNREQKKSLSLAEMAEWFA